MGLGRRLGGPLAPRTAAPPFRARPLDCGRAPTLSGPERGPPVGRQEGRDVVGDASATGDRCSGRRATGRPTRGVADVRRHRRGPGRRPAESLGGGRTSTPRDPVGGPPSARMYPAMRQVRGSHLKGFQWFGTPTFCRWAVGRPTRAWDRHPAAAEWLNEQPTTLLLLDFANPRGAPNRHLIGVNQV